MLKQNSYNSRNLDPSSEITHHQPLDPDEPEDVRGREVVGAEQLRHGEDPRELHQLLVLPKVPLALRGTC